MRYCLKCEGFDCVHFDKPPLHLTKRDLDLLQQLINPEGLVNKQIAFNLGLTEETVKTYLYNLNRKLGWGCTGSSRRLAIWAFMNGEKLGLKIPKVEG